MTGSKEPSPSPGKASAAAPTGTGPRTPIVAGDDPSGAPVTSAVLGNAILVNNVGYETRGAKRALVTGAGSAGQAFDLIDSLTSASVYRGTLRAGGAVQDWDDTAYLVADFSEVRRPGHYVLRVDDRTSTAFRIEENVLERRTAANVIHYFKGSRCSGQFDKHDAAIPARDDPDTRYDVRGGWYDATGDFGKYSWLHRTVWMLFACYDRFTARDDENFTLLRTWLVDEAMYGADYLVRMHPAGGTFYTGVSQPGPPKDPALRTLDTTQVIYGDNSGYGDGLGAGYAIAALALASTHPVSGAFSAGDYLRCAEEAWTALADQPLAGDVRTLTDALTAATALARATGTRRYRERAAALADRLLGRLGSWRHYQHYWTEDDAGTPYQDGTDAGHPVVALLDYLVAAPEDDHPRLLAAVRASLEHELAITSEVDNPFGYARQLVQDATRGERRAGYFLPHDLHPRSDDLWWQGENARLASLAAAARYAAPLFVETPDFAARLRGYADDQLNWILGVNPYASCMLAGSGLNNPQYVWQGSWQFLPYAGGISNGVTGRNDDGSGISWNRGHAVTGQDDDWRWQEQWLPHAGWYLFAVAIGERGDGVRSVHADRGSATD